MVVCGPVVPASDADLIGLRMCGDEESAREVLQETCSRPSLAGARRRACRDPRRDPPLNPFGAVRLSRRKEIPMCRRVQCNQCKKPTYAGCGAHVEAVLRDVPAPERCRCRESKSAPARQERRQP